MLLFKAAFVSSNYIEHQITIMITPADTYAPLLGKHAGKLYGPPFLAEFEEIGSELRHFLEESRHELRLQSTLKITVMPPMHVCTFSALAAHNLHKVRSKNRTDVF